MRTRTFIAKCLCFVKFLGHDRCQKLHRQQHKRKVRKRNKSRRRGRKKKGKGKEEGDGEGGGEGEGVRGTGIEKGRGKHEEDKQQQKQLKNNQQQQQQSTTNNNQQPEQQPTATALGVAHLCDQVHGCRWSGNVSFFLNMQRGIQFFMGVVASTRRG